ncbi:MAG: hypothetical protein RIC29_01950 [Rhodospirillaceae bacterium]
MLEYPVRVNKTDVGGFIATLVDFPDIASGKGPDPYAALQDLETIARAELHLRQQKGLLPEPSPTEDRPTVSFDEQKAVSKPKNIIGWAGQQPLMICHSWTNDAVYVDH